MSVAAGVFHGHRVCVLQKNTNVLWPFYTKYKHFMHTKQHTAEKQSKKRINTLKIKHIKILVYQRCATAIPKTFSKIINMQINSTKLNLRKPKRGKCHSPLNKGAFSLIFSWWLRPFCHPKNSKKKSNIIKDNDNLVSTVNAIEWCVITEV